MAYSDIFVYCAVVAFLVVPLLLPDVAAKRPRGAPGARIDGGATHSLRRLRRRLIAALAGLSLLAGCTVGPDFAPPDPGLPTKAVRRAGRRAAR